MAFKKKLEFQVFIASKQKYNQILYTDFVTCNLS